jgi:leucyl aminopeptidase (aminopeptidase T)
MRKVSLLIGTLGGALGAYLLNNKPLRDELIKSKDAESAAKLLGKHLQKDSKKLVKEVKTFVESDDVQKNLKEAKKYAMEKMQEAKKSMTAMVKKGAKKAKPVMKREVKAAKKAVSKASKKVSKAMDSAVDAVS